MQEESWADIIRPQAWDLGITTAFFIFALVSFFRRSVALKYATLAMSVAYLGVTKSTLISITDIFRFVHLDFPQFKSASPGTSSCVHRGDDGAVGAAVLRPHLRVRRADAAARRNGAEKIRWEPSAGSKARRLRQVRSAGGGGRLLLRSPMTSRIYPIRRAVLDVQASRHVVMWIGAGGAAARDRVRAQSLLPVPVPGRRDARADVTGDDGVPDQAVVRVQDLQDLREDLRVGRDPRAADRQSECVRCDDCERLYMDQKKCPHWLILCTARAKRAGRLAGRGFGSRLRGLRWAIGDRKC